MPFKFCQLEVFQFHPVWMVETITSFHCKFQKEEKIKPIFDDFEKEKVKVEFFIFSSY